MKTIKTTRRTNLAPVLCNLRRFENSTGSLYGHPVARNSYGYGRLNDAERDALDSDEHDIEYVVFSYATPIAWYTRRGWYIVGQKFSATTSCHQGQVSRGLAAFE